MHEMHEISLLWQMTLEFFVLSLKKNNNNNNNNNIQLGSASSNHFFVPPPHKIDFNTF